MRSRHGINRIQKLHDSVWSLLSPPHGALQVKACPRCTTPHSSRALAAAAPKAVDTLASTGTN